MTANETGNTHPQESSSQSVNEQENRTVFLSASTVKQRMHCSGHVAANIRTAFVTLDQLVDAIQSEKDLTEFDRIGPKTALVIQEWWDNWEEREENATRTSFIQTGEHSASTESHGNWPDIIKQKTMETPQRGDTK